MSIDATRWAWQQRDISPAQKLVLLSMADRAGETHQCWPSNARLCEDTGLERKTIIFCLKHLEARGLIRVTKRPGKNSVYQLLGVCGREDEARRSAHHTSAENGTGYTASEETTHAENGTSPKNGTGAENGTTPVPKTAQHQCQKLDTNLKRILKESPNRARVGREGPARKEEPNPQAAPLPTAAPGARDRPSLARKQAKFIPAHEVSLTPAQQETNHLAGQTARKLWLQRQSLAAPAANATGGKSR